MSDPVDGGAATAVRLVTVCGSLQARSANRSALAIAERCARSIGAIVVAAEGLERIPPLDADRQDDPGAVVDGWRATMASADVVLVAAPEYAAGVAGAVKNALDWLVGAGSLYRTPVAVLSAGSTGGPHARADLVRTLSWQGAYVVGELGIAGPRAKSDTDGQLTDPATVQAVEDLTRHLVTAAGLPGAEQAELARRVAATFGIPPDRITPPTP